MVNFKTSSWFVDADGKPSVINSRNHDDRFDAERQYHLYCASAATSEHPIHVALLESIEGVQIKRECYHHEATTTENNDVEGEDATE